MIETAADRRAHLDGVRPALYLAVHALLDVVGPDLEAVLRGEGEVRQRVLSGVLEQPSRSGIDGGDLLDGAPEPGVRVGRDEPDPRDPVAPRVPEEAAPRVERLDVDVVEVHVAARPVVAGGYRRDDLAA